MISKRRPVNNVPPDHFFVASHVQVHGQPDSLFAHVAHTETADGETTQIVVQAGVTRRDEVRQTDVSVV